MADSTLKNVVEIYGEMVAGDGYTWFYDEDSGEFITFFEYDGEGTGYAEGLKATGVNLRFIRLDEGDSGLDWEELAEWWEKVRYESLPKILKEAEELKLEVD